jgi:hypothetical protein
MNKMKTGRLMTTIPEVHPLVIAYYAKPGNSAGGNLHLVLDNYNVKNSHVLF